MRPDLGFLVSFEPALRDGWILSECKPRISSWAIFDSSLTGGPGTDRAQRRTGADGFLGYSQGRAELLLFVAAHFLAPILMVVDDVDGAAERSA